MILCQQLSQSVIAFNHTIDDLLPMSVTVCRGEGMGPIFYPNTSILFLVRAEKNDFFAARKIVLTEFRFFLKTKITQLTQALLCTLQSLSRCIFWYIFLK
jgi:hypothetical protein